MALLGGPQSHSGGAWLVSFNISERTPEEEGLSIGAGVHVIFRTAGLAWLYSGGQTRRSLTQRSRGYTPDG